MEAAMQTVGERAIARLGWKARPTQAEAVNDLINALRGKNRVVVFTAPTGAGKSGMSLAAARWLKKSTVIATPTIQLAEQWKKMLGVKYSVYGRQNYECRLGGTAADAPCIGGLPCLFKESCPYLVARQQCNKAVEFTTTHAFIAAAAVSHDPLLANRLIIIDECHQFLEVLEESLEPTGEDNALFALYPTPSEMKNAIADAARRNDRVAIAKLTRALKIALAATAGVLKDGKVDVKAFLSLLGRTLIMSATVPHELLAIADEAVVAGQMVPVKQRPIYVQPVGALRSDNCTEYAPKIADVIMVIAARHDGAGIIHTGNTRLAEAIYSHLKRSLNGRVYLAVGRERTKIIEEVRNKPDAVIVSPSMTMGVDFCNARWQVVAKVPFPAKGETSLDDAVTNFVQLYGRLVRSPEQTGVTYVLDANIRLIEEHLPDYVRQAMFWIKS
jgi:Rad3-related DNA helicase